MTVVVDCGQGWYDCLLLANMDVITVFLFV